VALAVERKTIGSLRFGAVIVLAGCGEDALGGDGTSADLAAGRQGALAAKLHIGESVAGGERLRRRRGRADRRRGCGRATWLIRSAADRPPCRRSVSSTGLP
jgi:hypothetical protein